MGLLFERNGRLHLSRTTIVTYLILIMRTYRGEMAVSERINYTDAVKCLTRKPPRLPTKDYPGVRSRFDDFVA